MALDRRLARTYGYRSGLCDAERLKWATDPNLQSAGVRSHVFLAYDDIHQFVRNVDDFNDLTAGHIRLNLRAGERLLLNRFRFQSSRYFEAVSNLSIHLNHHSDDVVQGLDVVIFRPGLQVNAPGMPSQVPEFLRQMRSNWCQDTEKLLYGPRPFGRALQSIALSLHEIGQLHQRTDR